MYASHWSSLTLFKISGFCCYALVLKIVEFVDLALIFFINNVLVLEDGDVMLHYPVKGGRGDIE